MKNPIKTYNFWLKIIGAALLIAFGFWLVFDKNGAIFIVLMFTGLLAGIFAIIRFVPLVRTLKSGRAKITCAVEIVIHIIIACLLIYGAISILQDKESDFSRFMDKNYRFIVAFFFYTRVVSYFMCTVLFKEETDKTKFWAHITLITISCVLCALSDIQSQTIAIIIGVIALLCSLGLIIDGAIGYNRYRKAIAVEREKKKAEEQVEEPTSDIEVPTDEVVIPMIDEEPKNDSTQVN